MRMVDQMRKRQELLELAKGKPPYTLIITVVVIFFALSAFALHRNADSGSMTLAYAVFFLVGISVQLRRMNDRLNAIAKLLVTETNAEPNA